MLSKNIFVPLLVALSRKASGHSQKMDLAKQFQNFAWCKPDWCYPSMSKETNELLKQCADIPEVELSADVDEVIARSKAFPIPFPIETVRLEKLKVRRPIEKLKKNIASTYPLIHERVLLLMTHFLIYKREFGSSIEKEFYKDMGVEQLINRILKKRAITFMGPADRYMLITGEEGSLLDGLNPQQRKAVRAANFRSSEGWESVGTVNQRPPLLLENCLSYDEMKISAMVYVSGHTECINDGTRKNSGVVSEEGAERDAVIIGTIGPRFQRQFRMDYEDILITDEQNIPENGYGEEVTPTTCLNVLKTTYVKNNQSAKHMWRQMWSEFYQVHSYTYEELTSYVNIQNNKTAEKKYTDRYIRLSKKNHIFDNEVYYKRNVIIAETVLLEADARAKEADKLAFVNVIGCGLGVWKISGHQLDVYILSFVERIRHLLKKDMLQHVSDVNFSYITPSDPILAMFKNTSSSDKVEHKVFLESKRHLNGGITVQIQKREPSARLEGDDEGKLLVMIYPWDGNAHPGNEFWLGKLKSSGDPAAACSTQVSELHNAHVSAHVVGARTHVAAPAGTSPLTPLTQYCRHAQL